MASIDTALLNGEQKDKASVARVDGVRLAKNTALNFAGQILPLLAGILLIPYIIRGLGPDRFGMLGIIWVVFGYFSLMDLGLGRATTKFLAEWLARGNASRISEMVWSSIALQFIFGVIGGIIIVALTPILLERVLKTPATLVSEARTAFYILAAVLPAILVMNGLRAVLEGCQRFDITNLLRIPSSTLAFVIPAVAVAGGMRLPGIVLCMGVFRMAFTLAHGYYCLRALPCLRTQPVFHLNAIFPLLSFGGWVTVSNAVNPVLVSMDRFLIGSLLSVAMVGYYTAPFEAVTKLWMVPASLMTTIYPACSALGTEHMSDLQTLYSRMIKYIFCAVAPVSLTLIIFARPIIGVWLGPGFVAKSALPLQLLTAGVFMNCFAHVPYSFLQALGRPDSAAKLFLCELVPYGLLLSLMIKLNGISGAAAAWSIRVVVEVLLLVWISRDVLSLSVWGRRDHAMWTGFGALGVTGVGMCATHFLFRGNLAADAGICAAWLAGFAGAVWIWVLDSAERTSVLAVFAPLRTVFGHAMKNADAE